MAINKNVVKIGLRVFAAITLIYLMYHLIPSSSTPWETQDHAEYGFVKDNAHTPPPPSKPDINHPYEESVVANPNPFPGDGHVYAAATITSAAPTKAAPTKAAPPEAAPTVSTALSQKPSKWVSTTYNDTSLPTPIKHLSLSNSDHTTAPSLLVCVMTKDSSSWGSDDRNFSSFLSMLEGTDLDASTISLAFLTSSDEEYETYRTDTVDTAFASVHLILHPGYIDSGGPRGFRHSSSIQHARRVEMARLRNYATLTSLQLSHQHVLWIDADVFELSTGLLQNMLNMSDKYPQAGIQTAISLLGDGDGDYDWNAWVGERTKPDEESKGETTQGQRFMDSRWRKWEEQTHG